MVTDRRYRKRKRPGRTRPSLFAQNWPQTASSAPELFPVCGRSWGHYFLVLRTST